MRPAAMPPLHSYAVYSDDTPNRSPRMWHSSKSLHLALDNLRIARNRIINPFVGDTFEVDRILPNDPAHPYGNMIGPIRDSHANYWGYQFSDHGRVKSVCIQKMPVTPGGAVVGSSSNDLLDPVMVEAVQRTDVERFRNNKRFYC
jgi:hypothetical protein